MPSGLVGKAFASGLVGKAFVQVSISQWRIIGDEPECTTKCVMYIFGALFIAHKTI